MGGLGPKLRRPPGRASAGAQGCGLREAERGRARAWGEAGPGGVGWSTPSWAQLALSCARDGEGDAELREAASSSASPVPPGRLLQPDPGDQSSPSRAAGLLKPRHPASAEPCCEPHARLSPFGVPAPSPSSSSCLWPSLGVQGLAGAAEVSPAGFAAQVPRCPALLLGSGPSLLSAGAPRGRDHGLQLSGHWKLLHLLSIPAVCSAGRWC